VPAIPRTKRRALVVNAFFGEARRPAYATRTVLRAMGPPFLAGWLAPERWNVRLHDEQTGGPLRSPAEVGEVDLLVLTGLTPGLDRMLHLAAFAKTANPRCVTVAGGPAVRAALRFAAERFDHACSGDVEELAAVVAAEFGAGAAAEEWSPRFDLAPWARGVIYAESSRACNFHCSFCSLTAEGRPFERYPLASLARQIEAQPPARLLVLIDNNFFGPDRVAFEERVELLGDFRARGRLSAWGALVTADFFADRARVERAVAAGCRALYCGIESFDPATLEAYDKRQNLDPGPVDVLRTALEAGLLPIYGLVLDVLHRSAAELFDEVAGSVGRRDGVIPNFVGAPIPYPGTPLFRECAVEGRLLPSVRVRDLNGSTLCIRPRDDVARIADLLRRVGALRGLRLSALLTCASAWRRRELSLTQLAVMSARTLAILTRHAPGSATRGRTFVGPTERLDELYRPGCFVAPAYRGYFEPTYLTDPAGRPAETFCTGSASPVGSRAAEG